MESSPSSSIVWRVKERGGSGGKMMALKSHKTPTPIADKENVRSYRNTAGKRKPMEIPTATTSRIASISHKPMFRRIPISQPQQTWKSPGSARGKNSNPSDFVQFLSDSLKDRLSTASSSGSSRSVKTQQSGSLGANRSGSGTSLSGFRVLDRSQKRRPSLDSNSIKNDLNVVGDCKGVESDKKVEKIPNPEIFSDLGARVSARHSSGGVGLDDCRETVDLSSYSIEQDDKKVDYSNSHPIPNGFGASDDSKRKSYLDMNLLASVERSENGFGNVENSNNKCYSASCLKQACENGSGVFKVLECSKENDVHEGNDVVREVNNYPSKLHEKLASLRGRVKRIASNINQTEEILDMNNTEESKLILSDIQAKISGIEKAMVYVNNNDSNPDSAKTVESENTVCKILGKTETKQVEQHKSLAKGFNYEELEARLFPHRKLLRNRKSLHTSLGSSQNQLPSLPESIVECVKLQSFEVQEMNGPTNSAAQDISKFVSGKNEVDIRLTSDETLEDFDDNDNRSSVIIPEEIDDSYLDQIHEIGHKASTSGWFVSEGEAVLLAHDDGSCSFYDIANSEEKAEYKPPAGVPPNIWEDCWLVRAPGADGCSGKYVVAASAGNALESGFCSWDFYTKEVQAFHVDENKSVYSSRAVLGPLPNNVGYREKASSKVLATENQQSWYNTCGPLIVSTFSSQKTVRIYDIRDGEQMIKWDLQRPVLVMDQSSPLQWKNQGKVVIVETENIRLWDVNSLNPQALLSVTSYGQKISALHVNNTDVELGGGVRQRVRSSEAEGNDGVFCTSEGINVLDFRLPSGVGLKISKLGASVQSVFSRGDSIFLGCTNTKSTAKESNHSQVQQFSLRKGRLVSSYVLPNLNAHFHCSTITQVWGNSNFVMGVSSLGLFVFDALKDDEMQSSTVGYENIPKVRDIIGPDDMYSPSFDYSSSRVLVISKDRPALWRHLL